MQPSNDPAIAAFVARIGSELVWCEVLVRPAPGGFELRHVRDRNCALHELRVVEIAELRPLAQVTVSGQFRPLKAAPSLQSGWICPAGGIAELGEAIHHLYPGSIADAYAAASTHPPVTHYREFTARQSGMYRLTAMLDDEQAGQVARACCHPRFCLKRRLWTVPGTPIDQPDAKSLIPCLEPCPVLLEFARRAMRIEQEDTAAMNLSASEVATIAAALRLAGALSGADIREADFSAAENPRLMRLLLEKLRDLQSDIAATPD